MSQDPQSALLIKRLRATYPDATYELNWQTPEQMLVAVILAAQSTDQQVNQVTATLFRDYPDPQSLATADLSNLETIIKSTGYYRKKAQTLQIVCRELVDRFQGRVPHTLEELTSIRGIARKTANVVLNCCFNLPSGIIVDTHVIRLSQRLGLSSRKDPERIEQDLMHQIPEPDWAWFGPAMVLHGRYVCTAKSPNCASCTLLDLCPRLGLETPRPDPTLQQTELPLFETTATDPETTGEKPQPSSVRSERAQPRKPFATEEIYSHFQIPPGLSSWEPALAEEVAKPYFLDLLTFVAQEREAHTIFPAAEDMFTAFRLTPLEHVKVLILGQDPYHDDGQAHGLSFSVQRGVKPPPSLKNIFIELHSDLNIPPASHGDLSNWAHQGVLLLNTVLTVRAHHPHSHKGKGWERFTDAVIQIIAQQCSHIIFVLWGGPARKKSQLIDAGQHTILESAHPSPLSARNGFFGSRPFSTINRALQQAGQNTIDWRLPN